jgi:UDP-glucose 6-dehydrogenase
MKPTIGFAGMTHLGINSAAAAAGHGFDTVCFDADAALIAQLKSGRLPVVEPGLPELLEANKPRITYTAAVADLKRCGVVYIAADVPTDDQGQSDLSSIRALAWPEAIWSGTWQRSCVSRRRPAAKPASSNRSCETAATGAIGRSGHCTSRC